MYIVYGHDWHNKNIDMDETNRVMTSRPEENSRYFADDIF